MLTPNEINRRLDRYQYFIAMSLADQIERIGRALTAEELSKLLSVSKITIFKHAAAGRIPSFRVGTCVRFDPRAVAQWLRSM